MKLSYEHQRIADADDFDLQQAIRQKHVPEKCLLGGVLVRLFVERALDPCAKCGIPRDLCGGRPSKDRPLIRPGVGAESDAKAVERLRHIIDLEKSFEKS